MNIFDRAMNHLDKAFGFIGAPHTCANGSRAVGSRGLQAQSFEGLKGSASRSGLRQEYVAMQSCFPGMLVAAVE